MHDALVPCARCARHLRASAGRCPFCGAAHEPAVVPEPARSGRLSRAALFAFGAALNVTGCNSEVAVPVYGAPAPVDAAADVVDATAADAPDADAVAVRYGAPPPPDAR